jgi:ribosomal protein L37AE/L43A
MPRMAEPDGAAPRRADRALETAEPSAPQRACDADDRMICERCGKAEMYRMHAVWRCPECGFKTDCCGW